MQIGFVGLGKLGLPVALAVESKGHTVRGYDPNPDVATYVKTHEYPYQEKGLKELLKRSHLEVTDLVSVVAQSDIVFLAVQTPHQPEFEGTTKLGPDRADFDYKYLKDAIQSVAIAAQSLQKPTFLAVISTCLPGTFRTQIVPLLNQYIDYVYTPQFIAMGTVIKDYLNPEFALIGVDSDAAAMKLGAFYGSLFNVPHVITDITTAEGIKVSYNTWITAKTVIANVWGELCEKLNMNFNDMFKAWGLSTDRLISTKYMEAGMGDGGGCLPPGELIFTYNGVQPIESIHIGDKVLTSSGKFHQVLQVFERPYEGDLVTVQVRGLNQVVRMTPEHPVLVRRDGRKRQRDGRRVTIQPIINLLGPVREVSAEDLTRDDLWGIPPIMSSEQVTDEAEYIELAGWYLSEGHIEYKPRRSGRINFSLHRDEEEDALRIEKLLLACAPSHSSLRGTTAKVVHRFGGAQSRSVRLGSLGLSERLLADFGKGAPNKRIPQRYLWGDLSTVKPLLRGLLRGDGCRTAMHFSTVSEELAWGTWILLHRFGFEPTMRVIAERISKKGQHHARAYEVGFGNRSHTKELYEWLDWAPLKTPSFTTLPYATDASGTWRHPYRIQTERYVGPVFNLHVDVDPTFVTVAGIVHNCHPRDNIALSWLACKTNSWDFFTDLMTAREMHEKFHADYIADLVDIYNLPVYILGKSFKPESNIETGSPALLLANILDTIYPKLDYAHHEDMVPIAQGIYFIATKNDRYRKYDFPSGSIVVDPFGYIPKDADVQVIWLGRK